jgi:hypothetical protein
MRNPFKIISQGIQNRIQTVRARPYQQLELATAQQQGEKPEAMVIGIPSNWFTFGYPPPMDFNRLEEIYRTFPMVSFAVEQLKEQAIGPGFYLKSATVDTPAPGKQAPTPTQPQPAHMDPAKIALQLCEDFNEKVHAKDMMMRIAHEVVEFGNCAVERRFTFYEKEPEDDYSIKKDQFGNTVGLGKLVNLEILPISTMRIVPSMYGGANHPKGYIEIIMGQYKKLAPEQIAWFKVNLSGGQVGDDFYGMGLIQPVVDYVWGLQTMEKYMIQIMKRYAAPKILWQLGTDKMPAKAGDTTVWARNIATVKPNEDYVSLHTVDAKTIEPDLRARFEEYVDHFRSMIVAGLQDPNLILMMQSGRVSDASASAMQEARDRKVQTIQENIKELWENLVLKVVVSQAGIDPKYTPEIMWGQPEVEDEQKAEEQLIGLLANNIDLSKRSRLDFENLLRQKFGMEPIDVQQELASQAAAVITAGQRSGLPVGGTPPNPSSSNKGYRT